jgi:hypothetical protein
VRYETRPRGYWASSGEWGTSVTADEVIEADKAPRETGLLDQHGDPIYRLSESVPMGFRTKA